MEHMRKLIQIIEGVGRGAFPMKTFDELFHIGTLNVSSKRNGSHEGAGLSITTEPRAWTQISSLVAGTLWRATKQGNNFLDYHRLNKANKAEMVDWGIANGYVEQQILYRNSWYDDELEQTVYQDFTTKEEAEIEAQEDFNGEIIPPKVIKKGGIIATDALRVRVMNDAPPVMVMNLLSTVFAEDALSIDGVWWQDRLDVSAYSAPRGVIVPSKITTWNFEKLRESF